MLDLFMLHLNRFTPIGQGQKVLLAVSGGMDSVAMVHLFHFSQLSFGIAHCNFGLRSEDSDGDELFVRNLARAKGAEFFTTRFDTQNYARTHGLSIQMAARQLRYSWFEKIRSREGYDYIATAHHRDDNYETVLINIIRGCGLRGLRGIPIQSETIIRPLAGFSKDEIESFVRENRIEYRTDISNYNDKYLRNKLRHLVVPRLKEINPFFGKSIDEISEIASEAVELLGFYIKKDVMPYLRYDKGNIYIPIRKILEYPSPRYLLFELLRNYNFSSLVVKDLAYCLSGQPGKLFYSPTHVCLKDRDELIISTINENDEDFLFLVEQGQNYIDLPGCKITFSTQMTENLPEFPKNSNIAYFDYDKIKFPLKLRHPRPGDYFIPMGMKGRKKVSNLLTDLKIPRTQKTNVWLLVTDETIIWVVGHRIHDWFRVTEGNKMLLKANFIQT